MPECPKSPNGKHLWTTKNRCVWCEQQLRGTRLPSAAERLSSPVKVEGVMLETLEAVSAFKDVYNKLTHLYDGYSVVVGEPISRKTAYQHVSWDLSCVG